jgi:hypothetical protein
MVEMATAPQNIQAHVACFLLQNHCSADHMSPLLICLLAYEKGYKGWDVRGQPLQCYALCTGQEELEVRSSKLYERTLTSRA